jgi:isoleucyl-tRNA synthetase
MRLSVSDLEKNILEYWKKNDTFQKSIEQRSADRSFVFYDGPPFATGLPHHGSLLASVIKDVVPRYKTMRGYRVERNWGWDCHGLPVENLVEGELGLNSKKDIEALGVDKFVNACRSSVLKYDSEWREYVDRTGRWVDFDNQYKTMDTTYMESVWWGFKQIHEKGLAYEGRHISLYCPRCSTPLSNFEIAMDNSYKDVEDHSTFVKFKVKGEGGSGKGDGTYFLAWTTTPWTLPGNVALAVDEKADYVSVEHEGEELYLAKDLVEKIFGEDAKIVKELKGADLVGKEYEPLYTYMDTEGKKAHYVLAADFVSLEDGTGIVHTAAIFGEDDYRLALKEDLPRVHTLDEAGHFFDFVTPFAGMFFKKSEKYIVADLEERGLLFKDEPYTHSYPFCWRCATPLYYNAVPAWFINIQKVKKRMIELNQDINWYPEHLKEGRFGKGLETAPDWNISRNRYWGTPLPVWECDESACEEVVVLGSIQELSDKTSKPVAEITDLHLPEIDHYSWPCEKCTGSMKRVSQVFDCWVESGSMPFASMHYPFENKEHFEQNFPGEFIAEYIAQTRGWFYTLHVLSTAIFDKPAFVNSLTTGTIQATDGQKMSKSKKNYTDPLEVFDMYGADAFRFYLMGSSVMQGENFNFDDDGVKDVYRKVVMLMTNMFGLYEMYAEQGHDMPTADDLKKLKLTSLDKWLLARWSDTLTSATTNLDEYNVVKPARELVEFINDFSTWYLRRSRDRFKGDDLADKELSLTVTRYVMEQLLHVLAPYTPFITEHLFQKLYPTAKDSIHLKDWPETADWMKNKDVVEEMVGVREIVEVALSARAEAGIKIRQVCQMLLVKLPTELKSLDGYEDLLKEEVNVKEVKAVGSLEEQPNYVNKEGKSAQVALNTELSEELLMEGLVRELVRQVNFLRKKSGLSINDRVVVVYQTDSDFIESVLTKFDEDLKKQTLSDGYLPESVTTEHQAKVKFHENEILLGVKQV